MPDPAAFPAMLALLGVVLLVAGLLSGVVEKSGTPQVAVFLALGAAVGPFGLRMLDVGMDAPALRIVATLSLALVLFTEALTLNFAEVRSQIRLAALILGPGTLLSTAIITLAAMLLLGVSLPLALIVGAALASTDPVLLRALLRWRGLPADARLALRLESGLNDIVLLPFVFVGIALAKGTSGEGGGFGGLFFRLFLLGPGAGVVVGLVAVSTLLMIRKRVGIRRDYESLYSIGVCFVAFGAAEAMHASGFVAAFAAGATIAALDVELCDCFLEYGETTAELAMLFAFVLLGTSLAWSGFSVLTWPVAIFIVLAFAARPVALWVATKRTGMEERSRRLLAWFGPRGLSSILLVLLPVFEGVPGSERLFQVSTLVMLVSVVIHGGSVMALREKPSAAAPVETSPEPEVAPVSVLPSLPIARADPYSVSLPDPEGMSLTFEAFLRMGADERTWLLDARSGRDWTDATVTAQGAHRMDPLQSTRSAETLGIGKDDLIGIYCACPAEETSLRASEELRRAGWGRAFALIGGWEQWKKDGRPTMPIA